MFWKRRKSNQQNHRSEYTSPHPATSSAEETQSLPLLDYEVAVTLITDVGCLRDNNEDSSAFITPGDPATLSEKGVLAIVADGMGGHSAGEVASRLAVDMVGRVYYDHPGEAEESIEQALLKANRLIYQTAQTKDSLAGMGTTCTALAIHQGRAISAHVGDSRLYLVRGGGIYLMSEDHSTVMEMVRQGILSYEDGLQHPDKNVLTRSLGTRPEVMVSKWERPFPLRMGDQFVLCSDGLYDLVSNDEIRQVVTTESAHAACQKLVELAKERGGPDNITIGLLQVKARETQAARTVKDTRELEVVR